MSFERLLIALPTYEEAGNIGQLLEDLRRIVPHAELLVIDDGSPDGTAEVAAEAAARLGQVTLVQRGRKSGLGTAHALAMARAVDEAFDVLVTMDCDYTHRPDDVPRLVEALSHDLDFVVGSRYEHPQGLADWPLWRRAITHTAHTLTRTLLGLPFDATNAFRAYRVDALTRVPFADLRSDGYSFMFEMVYACRWAGLRMGQVPVELPLRQSGESKISRVEVAKAVAALGRLSAHRARALLARRTHP
jgi:dolichol-phosphate mannosyltransferase